MSKFLVLVAALSATAFFSESAAPFNGVSALSVNSRHDLAGRRNHGAISKAKKNNKRRESKRCKARATTTSLAEATSEATPEATSAAAPNINVNVPAADDSSSSTKTKTKTSSSSEATSTGSSGGSGDSSSGSSGGDSSSDSSSGSGSGSSNSGSNSGSSSSVNKAGINWFESGDKLDLWKPASGSEGWMYNWTPEFSGGSHDNWEFVPMLWGYKFANDDWWNNVSKSGSKYVMSINEPDQTGQANMDAGALVSIYKKYMTPLRDQGYKLGLPATSSAPAGYTLVKDMLSQCGDACPYDFVPVHWYDVDFSNFQEYVEKWHDGFNKPIWVTEFACQNFNGGAQCDAGKIWWFMTQATLWMDSTDWIERYCAFGTMRDMTNVNTLNQLMDPSTFGPNALGKLYLALHL